MTEDAKKLVQRWFEEVWNKKREEAITEMFAEGGEAHGLPEQAAVIRGPEEFKKFYRAMVATFPDIHVHLDDLIAEGDRVAVRWDRDDDASWGRAGARSNREETQFERVFVSHLPGRNDRHGMEPYGLYPAGFPVAVIFRSARSSLWNVPD